MSSVARELATSPMMLFARRFEHALDVTVQCAHDADPRKRCRPAGRRDHCGELWYFSAIMFRLESGMAFIRPRQTAALKISSLRTCLAPETRYRAHHRQRVPVHNGVRRPRRAPRHHHGAPIRKASKWPTSQAWPDMKEAANRDSHNLPIVAVAIRAKPARPRPSGDDHDRASCRCDEH